MKNILLITFLGFFGQLQAQKSFGFAFANTPEKINIIKVFEIGPAQKAGVEVNDIWLKINNIVLLGKTNQVIGNILGQLQRDEATFEFSRNGKIINLKFSRVDRELFIERCISGNCIDGNGVYRFENGKTIEGEFKNGKYIDPYKPQFETSYLQPNTIVDQIDTSTLDNPDELHRQLGYHEYFKLIIRAQELIHGWGETKEINYDKAIAICTEAIRIFPNLTDAYITRGQSNSKARNTMAAQNDFDKAKTLSPYGSGYIDRAIAAIEGREYIDPRIQQQADIQRAMAAEQEKSKNTTQTQQITSHKCNSFNGSGTEEYVYNAFQTPLKRACKYCNGKGVIYD